MIKTMLKPIFKRYWGLFLSMAFVSSLAIGLFISFFSAIMTLRSTYQSYKYNYGQTSAIINTSFVLRSDVDKAFIEYPDITLYKRLTVDTYLKKSDGRIITSRIYTSSENKLN